MTQIFPNYDKMIQGYYLQSYIEDNVFYMDRNLVLGVVYYGTNNIVRYEVLIPVCNGIKI